MNKIVIELCAEDRARIDRLTEALEATAPIKVTVEGITTEAKSEPGAVSDEGPNWYPGGSPESEFVEPEDAAEGPAISLEQIRQKVTAICAADGGAKKADVRAIINKYGTNVTALKDHQDKWPEVWEALIALERED